MIDSAEKTRHDRAPPREMTRLAERLFEAARLARQRAHAPYSGFAVGAAVGTASGRVFAGCNVENAAYPEGMCAEAGAISAMVAAGEREILDVLVMSDSVEPVVPCGGCRQKLAEFANGDARVLCANLDGIVAESTLGELFPSAFSRRHLGQDNG